MSLIALLFDSPLIQNHNYEIGYLCRMRAKIRKQVQAFIPLTNYEKKSSAKLMGFQSLKQECPYEDHTIRQKARHIVEQMSSINPETRINLFNSIKRIDFEYLP